MADSTGMILRSRRMAAAPQEWGALRSSENRDTQNMHRHSCQGCEHYTGDGIPSGVVLFCFCMIVIGAACWGYFLGKLAWQ